MIRMSLSAFVLWAGAARRLGSVRLSEIAAVRGELGLAAERDLWFEADRTLSAYAEEAARMGRIIA